MKEKHLEVTPDGKQEIVEGAEPLKKKPKKLAKSLFERWEELKKDLDNATAIMPMEDDEEEEQAAQAEQQDGISPEEYKQLAAHMAGEGEEGQENSDSESSDSQEEDMELEEALRLTGHSDAEIAHILHGHIQPGLDPKEEKAKNEAAAGQIEVQNMQQDLDHARALKHEDAVLDMEHKKKMHELELREASERSGVNALDKEHKKRMLDLEYEEKRSGGGLGRMEQEHKKRMLDLEYQKAQEDSGEGKEEKEHKRKMLALEFEVAKKEKEMELEFKKKEHELKLKMMEEHHARQAEQKSEIADLKHQHAVKEAKKPPPKKPLKKSEDGYEELEFTSEEIEELEKALNPYSGKRGAPAPLISPTDPMPMQMKQPVRTLSDVNVVPGGTAIPSLDGWSHSNKEGTFALEHSTLGTISAHKLDDGSFEVKHNGKSFGKFPDIASAGATIKTRIGNLSPIKVKAPTTPTGA